MKHKFLFILVVVVLSGCSNQSFVQENPSPTILPSIALISLPTVTPTMSLESQYGASLQDFSPDYEWKFVDSLRMAVLIPHNWVFTEEKRFLPSYEGFYVTLGEPDAGGKFSIGFTAFMYRGFETSEEGDNYAKDLLKKSIGLETTKNVIDTWDYKTDLTTWHHLRIESEFSNETEENKHKIIHYGTFAYNDRVYLWKLESPKDVWDFVLNDYGVVFTRSEWFP
jgi:hypothetical protein